MRFTCDNCGTRYRLDDEKTRGRLVQVRCRKCAGIVTLRDGEKVPRDPPDGLRDGEPIRGDLPKPQAPASARRWYALVGGEQTGPLSDDALEQQIEAGVVLPSTFVWCDGMAEWKRLGDVPR